MEKATRALVSLEAIEANFRAIQKKVGAAVGVCPAVKANGYGHGAVPVAKVCAQAGARMLAVAIPAEAFEVREALPEARVLLFGGILEEDVGELVRSRIEFTVSNREQVEWIARAGREAAVRPVLHVKVDTGMGRIGVAQAEAVDLIVELAGRREVELGSVYSHFPTSDEADRSFARRQIDAFKRIVAEARRSGARIPMTHLANSGAILDLPESYLDMVRPGLMLYGCYPSSEASRSVEITPALKLVSRLSLVKEIPAGWTVSYGRTFTAKERMRIGVVAAGYADGLSRRLSNAGKMIVRGKVVAIIGRVCMDLTLVDLSSVGEAHAGDEVVMYSDRREDPNSVEGVAKLIGTIPQEVLCALTARVERVHVRAGAEEDAR